MAKKKASSLTAQYNKELRRIKQHISRAEKRGYIVPENLIPKKPKRVTTKSIERLKKFTSDTLYRKYKYVRTDTGEIVRGEVGRELERSVAGKKGYARRKQRQEANQMIPPDVANRIRADNFVEVLLQRLGKPIDQFYTNTFGRVRARLEEVMLLAEQGRQMIMGLVNRKIAELGKEEFGRRLQHQANDVNAYLEMLLYGSQASQINSAISGLTEIINGGNMSLADQIAISAFEEEDEDFGAF